MGNEQSNKKGKRILEEKKKQIANLTHKKEKLDKIHSAVNQDINQINNASEMQHPNSHTYNQNLSNQQNANDFNDNNLNRNNSFNAQAPHNNQNQINIDNELNYNNDLNNLKRNHSANPNRTEYINPHFINKNNNFNEINSTFNPGANINLQNIKNNDNYNYNNNNNIGRSVYTANNLNNNNLINNNSNNLNANSQINRNNQINVKNGVINNNSVLESKSEKLLKDLEIMDKLVDKFKIAYLDSYYFKRDKNYNQAINRNLEGFESIGRLLAILQQKKEKEYNKYINICVNLQDQFATLMQEIQSELLAQGKNPTTIINIIKDQRTTNNNNNNNNSQTNNNQTNINNNINNNNQNQNQNSPTHHKSNVPPEILERIKSEILDKNPKVKFDEVVGLENVKQALKEIIIIPSLRPDLFTGLRTPAKGLLLFGPPGTGKTLIAKAVATECKSVFFNISASSLTSKYVGESEKLVKALFEVARYPENQPAIIFIDEIESILSKRSENENEVSKRLKTEFLVQFDGVATNSNDKVLVIGATNRPQDLDPAVLRRLPKKIFVGPMDLKGRANFVLEILSKSKTENTLKDKDYAWIAQKTDNYSNSDLKEMCRQACIEPIRELRQEQLEKIDKLRAINLSDFEKAVKAVRGTLTLEMLKEYLDWNKENGAIN